MAQEFFRSSVAGVDGVSFDAGLRAHMQRVFNYMTGGLVLTGLVAYLVAHTMLVNLIFGSPLKYLVMLAPIGFVMYMSLRLQSMSTSALKICFWSYCTIIGLSMAMVFLTFTNDSVARAFFITAMTFGATSLWGYTTKRDLTGFGSFMFMGIFGLMIAMIVNGFLMSSALQWVSSVVGVVLFTGLTAFTVQSIKQSYTESWGSEANEKVAIYGALSLYMNFINAFLYLLELTGTMRRN